MSATTIKTAIAAVEDKGGQLPRPEGRGLRLRKKSCRVWRADITALRLQDIPQVSCSVLYVHSTNSVGMGFVTAFFASEGYTAAVISADVVTSGASLGSIFRIYVDYRYPGLIGFVFHESL